MLTGSPILVTGSTGSWDNTFVPMTLEKYNPKVPEGFSYTSNNNSEWMTLEQLRAWIEKTSIESEASDHTLPL